MCYCLKWDFVIQSSVLHGKRNTAITLSFRMMLTLRLHTRNTRVPTFSNKILDVLIKSKAMAFAPQPHVGGVILPAALVGGAHGEELPSVPRQQQLLLPAVQARAARPQREAVVGDVNKARVLSATGETPAPLTIPPGVRLVPVVGADSHRQHPERAQGERQTSVEQQLPSSHARVRSEPHQHHNSLDSSLTCTRMPPGTRTVRMNSGRCGGIRLDVRARDEASTTKKRKALFNSRLDVRP